MPHVAQRDQLHLRGTDVSVQRCLWHEERNVLGHLPERDRRSVGRPSASRITQVRVRSLYAFRSAWTVGLSQLAGLALKRANLLDDVSWSWGEGARSPRLDLY